jgi:hypothetical protein
MMLKADGYVNLVNIAVMQSSPIYTIYIEYWHLPDPSRQMF